MPDDQQEDGIGLPLAVWSHERTSSEQTQPVTSLATPDSLHNISAEVADKERTVHPNVVDTVVTPAKSVPFRYLADLPPTLQWIPANWTWSKWKPVLRSALAAWICLLLFLIPTTLNVMGQVSVFHSISLSLDLRNF